MCLLPPRHSVSRQGSQDQQEGTGPRSGVQPQQAGSRQRRIRAPSQSSSGCHRGDDAAKKTTGIKLL